MDGVSYRLLTEAMEYHYLLRYCTYNQYQAALRALDRALESEKILDTIALSINRWGVGGIG